VLTEQQLLSFPQTLTLISPPKEATK
jgi:hypothetical protein